MAVRTYPALGATGPESKTIAWTGFSIDTRDGSVYSAANGGHGDYAGNEVNRIKLTDNAPSWTEVRAATPASQVIASTSHYADGRPTSRHTYYGSVFNEVRGRAMTLGGSRYGDGFNTPSVDGFDVSAGDWDAAGTYRSLPSSAGAQGCSYVGRKSTGDVFVFCNWSVERWSNASNTWTKLLSNSTVYGQASAVAYDTQRNRILLLGGTNNDRGVYDVAANRMTAVSLTGSGAAGVWPAVASGGGMVYDPLLDAYLVRPASSGATVYVINASTFSVSTMSITGGASIPSSTNGVWTRFLYVPQLKGVVYFPSFSGGAWFLRTN